MGRMVRVERCDASSRHGGAIVVSAKRMRQPSRDSPSRGRADLARLREMTDEEIERTSPPELTNLPDDFWDEAVVVWPSKEPISLRVDEDVLEWFRASGPRYQSRMNAVLRSYMDSMQRKSANTQQRSKKKRSKRDSR
jgi:uncharacterized protein (DUF4415 family)